MKVVLFCGGLGLRLRDHSERVPKPMVPIGYRPILWHIMKYYAHFGHREFVVCVGHQAAVIKDYFERTAHGWHVEFVDTPLDAEGAQVSEVETVNASLDALRASFAELERDAAGPAVP